MQLHAVPQALKVLDRDRRNQSIAFALARRRTEHPAVGMRMSITVTVVVLHLHALLESSNLLVALTQDVLKTHDFLLQGPDCTLLVRHADAEVRAVVNGAG